MEGGGGGRRRSAAASSTAARPAMVAGDGCAASARPPQRLQGACSRVGRLGWPTPSCGAPCGPPAPPSGPPLTRGPPTTPISGPGPAGAASRQTCCRPACSCPRRRTSRCCRPESCRCGAPPQRAACAGATSRADRAVWGRCRAAGAPDGCGLMDGGTGCGRWRPSALVWAAAPRVAPPGAPRSGSGSQHAAKLGPACPVCQSLHTIRQHASMHTFASRLQGVQAPVEHASG